MADQFTPERLEEIFYAALKAGDVKGVEAALTVLAVRDPHRAQTLLDITRFALDVARSTTPPEAALLLPNEGS